MAEAIGPVRLPVPVVHELGGLPCPACKQPAEAVVIDAMATARPSDEPNAFGAVTMNVSSQPVRFTFHPCGCVTTPDGRPIPVEVPADPLEPIASELAATFRRPATSVEFIDAETREPLVMPGTAWPSPVKSRRGGHRGRARRR